MGSRKRRAWVFVLAGLLLLIVLASLPFVLARKKATILAEAALGDGRIIQIEAATFGTRHQVGYESEIVKRWASVLPQKVRKLLQPRVPQTVIERSEPVLVVWVNALNETFRTNVDCQGISLHFLDEDGTIYSDAQRSWYGGETFWREAHLFRAFPRGSKTLK